MDPVKLTLFGILVAAAAAFLYRLSGNLGLAFESPAASASSALRLASEAVSSSPSAIAQGIMGYPDPGIVLECHVHKGSQKSWYCNDAQSLPFDLSVKDVQVFLQGGGGEAAEPSSLPERGGDGDDAEVPECKVVIKFNPIKVGQGGDGGGGGGLGVGVFGGGGDDEPSEDGPRNEPPLAEELVPGAEVDEDQEDLDEKKEVVPLPSVQFSSGADDDQRLRL